MAELWPGGPLTLPHTFVHDGIELTVPHIAVPELLYWLSTGQWWGLYPNSVDQETLEPLRVRLFDPQDDLDMVHLHDVATTLFGRLAGVAPASGTGTGWWPAVRLAHVALKQWPLFNSWCVAHHVAPLGDTLMTAISASYAWLRDGLAAEQLDKLERDIWSTPAQAAAPAVDPTDVPEHIREEEAGAFLAALGESLPGQHMMSGVF